ncbi:non-canonical purine NTP diphosphatase [Carboxylicivirga sp. M1479]|uniref:non-canonical purine NTP diphosphatase n=1 Tax=Carboxylicivirga sp. M1479 TaxID=2594476 RepID=UPI001177DCC3|nr:non-canonical purine NTP diphosphatase [Carboxylicivirga sp. M1479]TRX71220.1 non-canonical purine NTP diphosphatase [Carboxylicivirga sp. M1479]
MELVFATNNPNKLEEIQALIGNQFKVLGLADIGFIEEIPETGDTLEENALQKSEYIFKKYKVNCFADDTGLEVDALNGEPGVYSARYAGEDKNADANMNMVLNKLGDSSNRKARFRTVISLIIKGKEFQFEGSVDGEILRVKTGGDGFGYDPIFKPTGFANSFAEMNLQEKNEISHRGRAMVKLIEFLKDNYA